MLERREAGEKMGRSREEVATGDGHGAQKKQREEQKADTTIVL
jgi:hypothetical protein